MTVRELLKELERFDKEKLNSKVYLCLDDMEYEIDYVFTDNGDVIISGNLDTYA